MAILAEIAALPKDSQWGTFVEKNRGGSGSVKLARA